MASTAATAWVWSGVATTTAADWRRRSRRFVLRLMECSLVAGRAGERGPAVSRSVVWVRLADQLRVGFGGLDRLDRVGQGRGRAATPAEAGGQPIEDGIG